MGEIATVDIINTLSGSVSQKGFANFGILVKFSDANTTRVQSFTGKDEVAASFGSHTQAYKACMAAWGEYPRQIPMIKILAQLPGESVTDALNAAEAADPDWYGYGIASRIDAEKAEAAAWGSGRIKLFAYSTGD